MSLRQTLNQCESGSHTGSSIRLCLYHGIIIHHIYAGVSESAMLDGTSPGLSPHVGLACAGCSKIADRAPLLLHRIPPVTSGRLAPGMWEVELWSSDKLSTPVMSMRFAGKGHYWPSMCKSSANDAESSCLDGTSRPKASLLGRRNK